MAFGRWAWSLGEPNASPPDARCGPSMGLRSLEVLLALALQAPLTEPHRRIRIGLPLAALDGGLTLAVLRGFESWEGLCG